MRMVNLEVIAMAMAPDAPPEAPAKPFVFETIEPNTPVRAAAEASAVYLMRREGPDDPSRDSERLAIVGDSDDLDAALRKFFVE